MKKPLFIAAFSLSALFAAAQSGSTSGVLSSYSYSDSKNEITIKLFAGEDTPKVGQEVEVKKEFTTKFFGADVKGTHGLAKGTVKTISTKELTVTVSEWTGTISENDEAKRPMAKEGDPMQVSWE